MSIYNSTESQSFDVLEATAIKADRAVSLSTVSPDTGFSTVVNTPTSTTVSVGISGEISNDTSSDSDKKDVGPIQVYRLIPGSIVLIESNGTFAINDAVAPKGTGDDVGQVDTAASGDFALGFALQASTIKGQKVPVLIMPHFVA